MRHESVFTPEAELEGSSLLLPSSEHYNQGRVSLLEQKQEVVPTHRSSIRAIIFSTLLVRIASRISFVLLGFYLGEHFTSATVVALVLEAFYISELLLSPLIGSLSDRKGRKLFLFVAPLIGIGAALSFLLAASLFPHPNHTVFNTQLVVLLLLVCVGRLLEGATTAFNTPASLGYIADITGVS